MAHPVLYISPDTAGLIYVNGHLAGECDADGPLIMPVAPQGALYMEYHPLRAGYLPVVRRLNLTGGYIAPGSEELDGMYIVAWPGSVIDVQITPERTGTLVGARRLEAGDCDIYLLPGSPGTACLVRGGVLMTSRLPEGSTRERALTGGDGRVMLLGRCAAGEFLQIFSPDSGETLLNVVGRSVLPADHGGVRVERMAGDEAGHELSEIWRPGPRGYTCEVTAIRMGAAALPATPTSAALMLGQAVLLGQDAEAMALLSEEARIRYHGMRTLIGRYDGCCALKYGAREGAVGLMKLVTPGYARVHTMEFDVISGENGWLIDDVRVTGGESARH